MPDCNGARSQFVKLNPMLRHTGRGPICCSTVGPMTVRVVFQVLGLLVAATTACGVVFDSKTVEIDLTAPDATNACEWLPSERYGLTDEGLGWEGSPTGQRINGGEIVVHPIAVGYFWRPANAVSIRVEILPGPEELKTPEGKPYWRNAGRLYARYSPDRVHWSTWQALSLDSRTNRVFKGQLVVPARERQRYERLRIEYGDREDVPWASDEEGAVRWILGRDPRFFAHNLPFIGYVQFLFEGEFVAGHRFKSIKIELSYRVGGLHVEPEDDQLKAQMWSVPWRFRGSSTQVKPDGPANESQPIRSETSRTPAAAGSRP